VPAVEPTVPTLVEVPSVVGLSLEGAVDLVTDRGLLLEERAPVASDKIPIDAVAEQDPRPAARVPQGSTVYVQRSQGADTVDLLALGLIGQEDAAAEKALHERGLIVELIDVGSADVPEGRVVAHDPGERASVGETVRVQVSKGDRVRIPGELQGQPLAAAIAQLEQLDLTVSGQIAVPRQTIEDAGVDLDVSGIRNGDVVGVQDNGAAFGAWVARGATVTVVYYDREADTG
jgi:beta-lactam-binding protein with PASTA domain